MLNLLAAMPSFGMMFIELDKLWPLLESTVIFVALGIVIFALAFLIVVLVEIGRASCRERVCYPV